MSHSVMREKGAMPWAFHDFWLRDMAHAKGPEYAFHGLSDKTGKNPRYLFFPGCQLAASEPRYATGTYRLLLRATSDTAIALGCCGAPAIWAGDMPLAEQVFAEIKEIWESYNRPVFILACPSCRSMFAQYLPEIETVFLLDHLSDMGIKPAVSPEAADIAVFDPCAARGEEKTRAAVRSVAAQAGYTVHELPHSGTAARCCSFGGQIDAANPPYKDWLVKQRAEESPLPYLVYCANCRDVFAGVGKKAVHALELFEGCGRKSENAPGIEARLQNRRRTKGDIMKEFFPGRYAPDEEKPGGPILYLEAGLEEKLDRERIFLADIAAVIKSCEESRRRLLTAEGHYVGHAEAGYMTYWVEYMPEDGGYRIFNAYGHRMRIEQDER
jgi:hypothetical protein